jgi:hypothetical protein
MKAYIGSKTPFILNVAARWRWVVNVMHLPLLGGGGKVFR